MAGSARPFVLWIVHSFLQGALAGVDRLYFHQGTIGNCRYGFWGRFTTGAPFYGAAFVSQFLGTDGRTLSALDDETGPHAAYAVFESSGAPLRVLLYNSAYYVAGSGPRSSEIVSLTLVGLGGSVRVLRLTAPGATARLDQGAAVTIGGGQTFDGGCGAAGQQVFETVNVVGGCKY